MYIRPVGPLVGLRRRVAVAVRGRVAGENAAQRARRIWDTPGTRWFTDDDPIWWVHSDASMFPGGIRALLLQSLHPLALAGVEEHSDYRLFAVEGVVRSARRRVGGRVGVEVSRGWG